MKGKEQEIKLVTFGSNKPKVIRTPTTKLSIKLNNGKYLTISANIVPDITGTIQRRPTIQSEQVQHLMNSLDMADTIPRESEYSTIELLIGNDYYLDIVLPQRIEIQPGLYLLSSKLGWILTGRTNESENETHDSNMLVMTYGTNIGKTNVFTSLDCVVPMKPDIEDFWNMESIGIKDDPNDSNDEKAM